MARTAHVPARKPGSDTVSGAAPPGREAAAQEADLQRGIQVHGDCPKPHSAPESPGTGLPRHRPRFRGVRSSALVCAPRHQDACQRLPRRRPDAVPEPAIRNPFPLWPMPDRRRTHPARPGAGTWSEGILHSSCTGRGWRFRFTQQGNMSVPRSQPQKGNQECRMSFFLLRLASRVTSRARALGCTDVYGAGWVCGLLTREND